MHSCFFLFLAVVALAAHVPSNCWELWTPKQVAAYLEQQGLSQIHASAFVNAQISGTLLPHVTDAMLRKDLSIGVIKHRLMVLRAISQLPNACATFVEPVERVELAQDYAIMQNFMMMQQRNKNKVEK